MSDARHEVVDIEVRRAESVRLTYGDGVVIDLPVGQLREVCPCAGCRGKREQGGQVVSDAARAGITIVDAELNGAWGLSIRWSDGHDTGIYAWTVLRDWWDAGHEGPLVRDG